MVLFESGTMSLEDMLVKIGLSRDYEPIRIKAKMDGLLDSAPRRKLTEKIWKTLFDEGVDVPYPSTTQFLWDRNVSVIKEAIANQSRYSSSDEFDILLYISPEGLERPRNYILGIQDLESPFVRFDDVLDRMNLIQSAYNIENVFIKGRSGYFNNEFMESFEEDYRAVFEKIWSVYGPEGYFLFIDFKNALAEDGLEISTLAGKSISSKTKEMVIELSMLDISKQYEEKFKYYRGGGGGFEHFRKSRNYGVTYDYNKSTLLFAPLNIFERV